MALGPKQMGEAILRNLKEKTGKTVDEWIALIEKNKLSEKEGIIYFLKKENGVGHFQAQKIFEHFTGKDSYENPEGFADKLFHSNRSKELYKFVKSKILALGEDIRVQPCQTYIPFYRKNQFAILTTTKDEDLILAVNLPDDFSTDRFSDTSSIGSRRINHAVTLEKISDFDQEIERVLLTAYQNN
ncbi:hypothetical protein MTsPCn5_39460 [Croceitalea sp. MTPC5]|uniref:DUF5655 domain-containing protein n=1 Tax=Croceitalea sp. MTPC5 TaxID=3056565 RepID=UPI002B3B4212|nr:hypothetical protein MTsPCn5_39460 [Croceitalea sp. MTPC5]